MLLDWLANLLRLIWIAPIVLSSPSGRRRLVKGPWHLAVVVGLLSPASYILVLVALSKGASISAVAPCREMSMMVGALFGRLLLGESVGRSRLVGCLVLFIGVALLVSA